MKFTTSLFAIVAALASFAAAKPALDVRATADPGVLYPHSGTVWASKSHHNITWYESARDIAARSNGISPGLLLRRAGAREAVSAPRASGLRITRSLSSLRTESSSRELADTVSPSQYFSSFLAKRRGRISACEGLLAHQRPYRSGCPQRRRDQLEVSGYS